MERILSSINVAVQTEKSHTKNRNFVPITYLAHTHKFKYTKHLIIGLKVVDPTEGKTGKYFNIFSYSTYLLIYVKKQRKNESFRMMWLQKINKFLDKEGKSNTKIWHCIGKRLLTIHWHWITSEIYNVFQVHDNVKLKNSIKYRNYVKMFSNNQQIDDSIYSNILAVR